MSSDPNRSCMDCTYSIKRTDISINEQKEEAKSFTYICSNRSLAKLNTLTKQVEYGSCLENRVFGKCDVSGKFWTGKSSV